MFLHVIKNYITYYKKFCHSRQQSAKLKNKMIYSRKSFNN